MDRGGLTARSPDSARPVGRKGIGMQIGSWTRRFAALVVSAVAALATQASGQVPFGLNIDIDFNFPGEAGAGPPSAGYGAAAGQTGSWNSVMFGTGPFNLIGLTGAPTTAQISRSISPPASTIDLGATGDYARLVYDADRIDGSMTYTITGLPAGSYMIYTYAAAPSFGTVATRITINGEAQLVAGAANDGTFALGQTHSRHSITHTGEPLTILVAKASINGVVNGFQIVPVIQPAPGAFSIIAPANGATGTGLTPTLAWGASSDAVSYTVMLDNDAAFTPPLVFGTTTMSTSVGVPAGALVEGTQYFWRVTATNSGGSTIATPNTASFTTAVVPPPPPPEAFGLNIDIDFPLFGEPGTGVPAVSYGAAASQPGTWNAVSFGTGPFSLNKLDGTPSGVQVSRSLIAPAMTFDLGSTGNYARLVYDGDRIDGPTTYTFTGLPAGNYSIYTYAAAPTFSTVATRITINGVMQLISGAPSDNTFSLGFTHARHMLYHPGGSLVITADKASINGIINGFQIVPDLTPTAVISSPGSCSIVRGPVPIIGTASAPGLTGWTLEYTGGDRNGWVEIASRSTGVTNGLLAEWDVRGYRPCAYTIRLRVTAGSSTLETMRSFIVAVPGDANLDGIVDFNDISVILTNFNQMGP